jgi:hypothetical protein
MAGNLQHEIDALDPNRKMTTLKAAQELDEKRVRIPGLNVDSDLRAFP